MSTQTPLLVSGEPKQQRSATPIRHGGLSGNTGSADGSGIDAIADVTSEDYLVYTCAQSRDAPHVAAADQGFPCFRGVENIVR